MLFGIKRRCVLFLAHRQNLLSHQPSTVEHAFYDNVTKNRRLVNYLESYYLFFSFLFVLVDPNKNLHDHIDYSLHEFRVSTGCIMNVYSFFRNLVYCFKLVFEKALENLKIIFVQGFFKKNDRAGKWY